MNNVNNVSTLNSVNQNISPLWSNMVRFENAPVSMETCDNSKYVSKTQDLANANLHTHLLHTGGPTQHGTWKEGLMTSTINLLKQCMLCSGE